MSLADLLPAIRALPADDRRRLVHLLVDELAEPAPPVEDELPDHIRELLSYGGVINTGYQVTTDAAGFQHFLDAMSESKGAP
ncbi:MAG: hypothetical protein K2X87_14275 [Gemmataceae bacterium]|nr:hypothetical protein [Gemmataceae bacterium]